jgi:hypothetical protein
VPMWFCPCNQSIITATDQFYLKYMQQKTGLLLLFSVCTGRQ